MTTPDTPTRARRLPPWLLEGALIVVSVLLGFAVTEFGDYRKDRELVARALTSLRVEIEQNMASVEPLEPVHRAWITALAKAVSVDDQRTGLDVLFATRPPLPAGARSPFPILRESAWDATVGGGALRLIDYDVATTLSEIYKLQEVYADNLERLTKGPLASVATFDPATRAPAVRLLGMTLRDIQSAETGLLELYKQHLPQIRAAADAAGR